MSKRKNKKSPRPEKAVPARVASAPAVRRSWLMPCFALVALVFLAFYPILGNSFIGYDDPSYVTGNDQVRAGLTWSNLLWAFGTADASNWHPLTWLSHMLDCQVFGLQPWGHHLTSLLLHVLNTLLVFAVFTAMTGRLARSFFIAAFFGLHPLHVESVAWASERKDVLSTAFLLLTLWAYVRYATESKTRRPGFKLHYAFALLFFACGLMSKPMLVTLPCLLLLLDFWPLNRWSHEKHSRLIAEKIPFFLLAAISCVITVQVQRAGGAVATVQLVPFADRWQNAVISYAHYLVKAFWPANLAVFYPHPASHLPPEHWPMPLMLASGLLVLAVSILAFAFRRRLPWLFTGWFWYVGMLVPVIGVLQVGLQAFADRYTYVPFIGLFVVVVWGAAELAARWRLPIAALRAATVAILAACLVLTHVQAGYWRNDTTLFSHAIAVTRGNYLAHCQLGNVQLLESHRPDLAIPEFEEALRLGPSDMDELNNLGTALMYVNRMDDAIARFQEAIRLWPDRFLPHISLGVAWEQKGSLEEATREFTEAVRLNPDYFPGRCDLGLALERQKRFPEATVQFAVAVRLNPRDPSAHNYLGVALAQTDRNPDAIREFQEALRLKPDFADALGNLARATNSPGTSGIH